MAQYDELVGADSLHYYLSGAASDGGAQAEQSLSLGNYRSSSEVDRHVIAYSSQISNITVQRIGGPWFDDAILSVDSTDVLKFAVDGGTAVSLVTILNGETKLIPMTDTSSNFIVVTRTSADALTSTTTFTVTRVAENVISGDNITSQEATDGDDEYRAIFIKNDSGRTVTDIQASLTPYDSPTVDAGGYAASGAVTITATVAGGFSESPETGWVRNDTTGETMYYESRTDNDVSVLSTGRDIFSEVGGGSAGTSADQLYTTVMVRLGIDAPSAPTDGFITDNISAGIHSPPVGVTFYPGFPKNANLLIDTMLTDEQYGLWIWRKIDAPFVPLAEVINFIRIDFNAHDI